MDTTEPEVVDDVPTTVTAVKTESEGEGGQQDEQLRPDEATPAVVAAAAAAATAPPGASAAAATSPAAAPAGSAAAAAGSSSSEAPSDPPDAQKQLEHAFAMFRDIKDENLTSCPVIKPTWEEFVNFEVFVENVKPLIKLYGAIKVIPPKRWVPNRSGYRDISSDAVVHSPIRQLVRRHRKQGAYQVINVVEKQQMTIGEFRERAMEREKARSGREQKALEEKDWAALTRAFWSNILVRPPLYGADSSGSLFDKDLKVWNLQSLPSMLTRVLAGQQRAAQAAAQSGGGGGGQESAGSRVPATNAMDMAGITSPMLYFGQAGALFPWHLEDMNLMSINFVHIGAPKRWYVIPSKHAARFERVAQSFFPLEYRDCPEFLRHKAFLVSPKLLEEKNNIKCNTILQREGEFVITWSRAYHTGFNIGWNVAESVNFASPDWIPEGMLARRCVCLGTHENLANSQLVGGQEAAFSSLGKRKRGSSQKKKTKSKKKQPKKQQRQLRKRQGASSSMQDSGESGNDDDDDDDGSGSGAAMAPQPSFPVGGVFLEMAPFIEYAESMEERQQITHRRRSVRSAAMDCMTRLSQYKSDSRFIKKPKVLSPFANGEELQEYIHKERSRRNRHQDWMRSSAVGNLASREAGSANEIAFGDDPDQQVVQMRSLRSLFTSCDAPKEGLHQVEQIETHRWSTNKPPAIPKSAASSASTHSNANGGNSLVSSCVDDSQNLWFLVSWRDYMRCTWEPLAHVRHLLPSLYPEWPMLRKTLTDRHNRRVMLQLQEQLEREAEN